jgi:hypothetical protein
LNNNTHDDKGYLRSCIQANYENAIKEYELDPESRIFVFHDDKYLTPINEENSIPEFITEKALRSWNLLIKDVDNLKEFFKFRRIDIGMEITYIDDCINYVEEEGLASNYLVPPYIEEGSYEDVGILRLLNNKTSTRMDGDLLVEYILDCYHKSIMNHEIKYRFDNYIDLDSLEEVHDFYKHHLSQLI